MVVGFLALCVCGFIFALNGIVRIKNRVIVYSWIVYCVKSN